ncbi:hypothetical protein [Nevskia sp.]|uniref:hypothetical protein n=1 Tax=Nevskia sp. TaxID=1929292 RepID=UPI0025D62C29|nr:hypothetical protein [Nevskia sp.]
MLQDDAQINAQVLNVTRQVNRAALGLDNRQVFFKAAYFAMSDEVIPSPGITNLKA